jgi:hypothetical protein
MGLYLTGIRGCLREIHLKDYILSIDRTILSISSSRVI